MQYLPQVQSAIVKMPLLDLPLYRCAPLPTCIIVNTAISIIYLSIYSYLW